LAWDDQTYLLGNALVTDPASASALELFLTPQMGYVVPVLLWLQAGLYALGGGQPWSFHAANLLLHAGAAWALFALARRLAPQAGPWAAWLAAALFAVHPLVAEPVAWATGMKDLLSTLLALGACLAFVGWEPARGPRRLAWAGGLALAAMLAKPSVLLLGLAWGGLALAQEARRAERLRASMVLLFVGALLGAMNWFVRAQFAPDHAQASANPALALGAQAWHTVWPVALEPLYLMDRGAPMSDPLSLLGLASLGVVGAWAWVGRRSEAVGLGLGFAAACYLPVSNLLPFNRFLADSYMYAPLAGLALALVGALGAVERLPAQGRVAAKVAGVGLVLALAVLAARQGGRWASHEALWGPLARQADAGARPWILWAQGSEFEQDPRKARDLWRQAALVSYEGASLTDLARSFMVLGEVDEAECLLVEEFLVGPNPQRAALNLARFLVLDPKRPPRYPGAARRALEEALGAGPQRWSPAQLQAAREVLGGLPQAPPEPWSQRRCPSLRGAPDPALLR
jgi:4-amino-4-deoxy-L-arabinose transferase-like glycosyltransferase